MWYLPIMLIKSQTTLEIWALREASLLMFKNSSEKFGDAPHVTSQCECRGERREQNNIPIVIVVMYSIVKTCLIL